MSTYDQPAKPRAWSDYYDFDLSWIRHVANVVNHLPMMRAIQRERAQRILEVGSGTGSLAIFLSYLGKDVTSVDLSHRVLAQAERNSQRLRGRVRFMQADAYAMHTIEEGSYDLAMSQGFFEHFDDVQIHQLLREQLRVARQVVFSVPNDAYGKRDRGDERLLTKAAWDGILRDGGFTQVRSSVYRPVARGIVTARAWRTPPTMYLAIVSR